MLDSITGLAKLPEGYVWEVKYYSADGDWYVAPGVRLYLMKRYTRKPILGIPRKDKWDWLTQEHMNSVVWNHKTHEERVNWLVESSKTIVERCGLKDGDDPSALFGTYPPKSVLS